MRARWKDESALQQVLPRGCRQTAVRRVVRESRETKLRCCSAGVTAGQLVVEKSRWRGLWRILIGLGLSVCLLQRAGDFFCGTKLKTLNDVNFGTEGVPLWLVYILYLAQCLWQLNFSHQVPSQSKVWNHGIFHHGQTQSARWQDGTNKGVRRLEEKNSKKPTFMFQSKAASNSIVILQRKEREKIALLPCMPNKWRTPLLYQVCVWSLFY